MRYSPAFVLLFALGCTSLPGGTGLQIGVEPTDDPLTLAAECLARGDEPAAANHFTAHLRQHPDQLMFRLHLADLLLKLHREKEAQAHYERFIAGAQESSGSPRDRIVHCHTRLMEIAQLADDRFAELLHRGIGLVILTRQETDDLETREEILCKAIAALGEAKVLRPTDPRVHVYLAEAHDRAGNRRAADVARAAARNLAAPDAITSSELRNLEVSRP